MVICTVALAVFLNLHYSKVMAGNLTREGIESNPGPRNFAINKSVLASHHQGDARYPIESAGKQCTANAYVAIVLSVIKNVNIWKTFDLDYVLEQADRIFNDVCRNKGIYQPLAVDELPPNFLLEGINVSAQRLVHESHIFSDKNNLFENYSHYDANQKGNGAIFTCNGFSVAAIWGQDHVFVFDSHSRNRQGLQNGEAYFENFVV